MLGFLLAASLAAPRVDYVTLDSAAEGREMTYGVYTPPGWDGQTPLPLVVFLHGGGDNETAWQRHPIVTRRLDAAIEEGRLPPFLAVIPDGTRGFWVNWHDGTHRFADWVVDEVIPDAHQRFPLLEGPEHQHLIGISMGGMGTSFIGLDHLDLFASLSVISAPVLDADGMERMLSSNMAKMFQLDRIVGPIDRAKIEERTPYRVDSADDLQGRSLFVAAGRSDIMGILPANRKFHGHLVDAGVPHTYQEFPGGHQWTAWSKVFPVALCLALDPEGCDPGDAPGLVRAAEAGQVVVDGR